MKKISSRMTLNHLRAKKNQKMMNSPAQLGRAAMQQQHQDPAAKQQRQNPTANRKQAARSVQKLWPSRTPSPFFLLT
jgi:hypothetical protein